MFTPRTPRLGNIKAIIVSGIFLLIFFECNSQDKIQLISLDSLEQSLKDYYGRSWQAERENFLAVSKGEIWAKLPSIGIQFGLPSVQFGTKDIYNIKQSKREKKAALVSLDLKYRVQFNEALQGLEIEYNKVRIQLEKLEYLEKSIELEEQIFKIHEEAFQKRELAPLEYLNRRKSFENVKSNYEIEKREVQIQILELYKIARWKMRNEEL